MLSSDGTYSNVRIGLKSQSRPEIPTSRSTHRPVSVGSKATFHIAENVYVRVGSRTTAYEEVPVSRSRRWPYIPIANDQTTLSVHFGSPRGEQCTRSLFLSKLKS